MKGYDAFAGVIKSGGKTRRAAKMVILNAEHPGHRRVHQLQGRGREEGVGADRRRLRRLVHRHRLHLGLLPELEQQRPRHRRLHARGARRWRVADEGGDATAVADGHLQGARPDAADRRGHVGLRRPRHAVRHDRQRVAHLPEHGPHQREQPVLGIHVPGRLGVQPGVDQPDEVRQGRRRARRGGVQGGLPHADHRAGDHRPELELSDEGDREELARLPAARPRLRQPRRAADVARPAVRQRRGARLCGGDHRGDDRRGLRAVGADRARPRRSVRRLREEPRAVPARDAQASRRGDRDQPEVRAVGSVCRRQAGVGRGGGARRGLRLPQRAGDRAGADRHHRLHDGLRHHRRRAGHRARQVQEAGRRRADEDRQRHRADGAREARLHQARGRGDRPLHRRARDDRRGAVPQGRAPAGVRLRVQGDARASGRSTTWATSR